MSAKNTVPNEREFGFRTKALHAGSSPDPQTGARAVPIYQTSSFVFENTEDAGNLFALQKYGNIYSRIANPTVAALEEKIASLEGGLGAIATSSGQAAQFLTFAALAGAGDEIIASSNLYGGTLTQLDVTMRRFGVNTIFITSDDLAAYAAAITDRTRFIYAEAISNPSNKIADIAGLAKVAHEAGIPLIIDNTVGTPFLVRPIEHGADIVLHSVTKYLGGHGTTLGGAIVDAGKFNWGNGRFPMMTTPVASYGGVAWWDNFGEFGFLTKIRSEQLRDIGAALSPMSAFLLLQGIETLPQRMQEHVANAQAVAQWLASDARIAWVSYAGLPSHPHHARAQQYAPNGPSAVFSFGAKPQAAISGREVGEKFINSVRLASHLANIGDVRTLVIHPGSTTHRQLTDEQLLEAGVPQDLIRISVGIEDLADILWDLDQALTAATGVNREGK
jgi:O-acetylhomoserine (thiol)-lyase